MDEIEITVSGLQNSVSGGFLDLRRIEEGLQEELESTMARVATMAESVEDMEEYIALKDLSTASSHQKFQIDKMTRRHRAARSASVSQSTSISPLMSPATTPLAAVTCSAQKIRANMASRSPPASPAAELFPTKSVLVETISMTSA